MAIGDTQLSCMNCGELYTKFKKVAVNNPAIGGAQCRSCRNLYCEPYVARVLYEGPRSQGLMCGCGKSTASRDDMGQLSLNNFEELVLYKAG